MRYKASSSTNNPKLINNLIAIILIIIVLIIIIITITLDWSFEEYASKNVQKIFPTLTTGNLIFPWTVKICLLIVGTLGEVEIPPIHHFP